MLLIQHAFVPKIKTMQGFFAMYAIYCIDCIPHGVTRTPSIVSTHLLALDIPKSNSQGEIC